MKKNILFLLITAAAIVGCRSNNAPVDVDDVEYVDCINCGNVQMVKYSMPNGNDLQLETADRVITIEAKPGKQYNYYVWTGDKTYDDDPDLIIQDGVASVLVNE